MGNASNGKRVLGLSGGQPFGSAEILLKAALRAAEEEGSEVELVRLGDLSLVPDPLAAGDHGAWLWERLVACDALLVSSPIIARTISAPVKLAIDRLLGPNADVAVVEEILAARREGRDPQLPIRVDERVLKPRVAGFIAVGGSLTPQWKSLTLPGMHALTFSMQIAVVDQVQFGGAGTPKSIVLDPTSLERAAAMGRNVAAQAGVAFDRAEYKGDDPGLCPMCHLNVLELHGREILCATCGVRGELHGEFAVDWTDLSTSVISMDEKRAHFAEVLETARDQAPLRERIEAAATPYAEYDPIVWPPGLSRSATER